VASNNRTMLKKPVHPIHQAESDQFWQYRGLFIYCSYT
jgi:hypothetical protein